MSEFREDPVSKDWIIMAPERARRPHTLLQKRRVRQAPPTRTCPFEDLEASGNWPAILSSPKGERWRVVIVPNKYPALIHHPDCSTIVRRGPYRFASGIGRHDLVITRDHRKQFADLAPSEALTLLLMIQRRYRMLVADRCLIYTSTFFNWGAAAGASIYHPHYQMLTLPIIPKEVEYSLRGSRKYWRKHRRCVHCVMLVYERRVGVRIVKEDRRFVSLAPFVSRQAFEVRVFPKRHLPFFEQASVSDLRSFIRILQQTLKDIRKNLHDPDFNFFIHTAPIKNQKGYEHYHWHVEILPKLTIPGGFELGSGVELNVINPDEAARILRQK